MRPGCVYTGLTKSRHPLRSSALVHLRSSQDEAAAHRLDIKASSWGDVMEAGTACVLHTPPGAPHCSRPAAEERAE
jgi:hypothetical protein